MTKKSIKQEWYTLREASLILGCSTRLLNSLIVNGELEEGVHFIDLCPNGSRRNYRINIYTFVEKGIKKGVVI